MSPRASKESQKLARGSQNGAKGSQTAANRSQQGHRATKIRQKVPSEKGVEFIEKGRVAVLKLVHFSSKIDEQIDANIDAKKVVIIYAGSMRKWS